MNSAARTPGRMLAEGNDNCSDGTGSSEALSLAELDVLLEGIQALPPSPYPLPELFKVLMDPNADLNRVVELITFDPGLTAHLLRLCNSAFFARSTRARDVGEAVNRLGLQTVYQVVASVKGPQVFQGKAFGHDPQDMWSHSVMSAMMAQFMAEELGEHGGLFFTAGLLHDLGKVIMGKAFKEAYAAVVTEARENRLLLYQLEQARFGVDHAAVAGRLMERWRFSPALVESIRFHHQPGGAGRWKVGASIVQGASAFSHAAHPSVNEGSLPWEAEEGLRVLGWTMEGLGQYWARLEENMAMVKMLLRMGE